MKAPGNLHVTKISIPGTVKLVGLIGLVWGFLSGIIILASYLQGYISGGDTALLLTGLVGFVLMIVYGVLGGAMGGGLFAFLYNRVLGKHHGLWIEVEYE